MAKINLNCNFFMSLTLTLIIAVNLMLGVVLPCRAAIIIDANHGPDGFACPGEELVYICVSQGNAQRWHVINEDGAYEEHIYSRTNAVGAQAYLSDGNQNLYTLVLNSTAYDAFTSTISAVATMSMHNIRLECRGHLPASVVIQIAGIPMSPVNIRSTVNEYHDHFSTVLFTWDAPDDSSRVDYYQYQVVNGTGIIDFNTSNVSVIIPGVPYSKNVTFSVLAGNCIGESATLLETINIVGCSKIDDSDLSNDMLFTNSTFSQAPGTKISLLCSNSNKDVIIVCQDNGRWEPDPGSGLCSEDPPNATVRDSGFVTTSTYSTLSVTTTETPVLTPVVYVYILTALISVCTIIGFISCCIYMLRLYWKKRNLRQGINVNHDYYEVIDPFYEAISTQIKVENNDAYKSAKLNETSSCASVGTDIENNETYTFELEALQMEHNKSYVYQGLSFDHSNPAIPDGQASTQECCENKIVCSDENFQQGESGEANIHMSQSDQHHPNKIQNQGEFIPLCTIESVDMDSRSVLPGSYSSTKQKQQGFNKLELSCEKQSIN